MAYKTESGIVLRTPSEKAKRYSRQLKTGVVRETGKKLTKNDKAWRVGYIACSVDSAKAHNSTICDESQCQNKTTKSKNKRKK